MSLTWVIREQGETLWDHLRDRPAPRGASRFVWIAAEQALVRKARARFRGELGVRPHEGYFAYYWTATRAPAPHQPGSATGEDGARRVAALRGEG